MAMNSYPCSVGTNDNSLAINCRAIFRSSLLDWRKTGPLFQPLLSISAIAQSGFAGLLNSAFALMLVADEQ
jgi:hypothetical protein